MSDEQKALLQYFGYEGFREGQQRIVRAQLDGRDVLAVMPTGHGKSVVFWLPALMSGRTTIVVIPLLALADDQLDELARRNIAARKYNSSVSAGDKSTLLAELAGPVETRPRLLYVTPESFQAPAFLTAVDAAVAAGAVGAFVVDEVHTMVEWGADFRPDFLKLSVIRTRWPRVPIAAFTATADRAQRLAIARTLALAESRESAQLPFNRPNITPVFLPPDADPLPDIAWRMKLYAESVGSLPTCIAYCSTQKGCERMAAKFAALMPASNPAFYHGGMSQPEKDAAARRWKTPCTKTVLTVTGDATTVDDTCYILFATNAFGMGVNKRDGRFVFQVHPPRNVHEVMQMSGRAGRDEKQAFYFFYVNFGTIAQYERWNKDDLKNGKISAARGKEIQDRLNEMRTVMRMGSKPGQPPLQCRRAIIISKIDGNEGYRVRCTDPFAKCDVCAATKYEYVVAKKKAKRPAAVKKAIQKKK